MSDERKAGFARYRPASALVRAAQMDLLFKHIRSQTLFAPLLALFLVVAFGDPDEPAMAWIWLAAVFAAYLARSGVAYMLSQGARVGSEVRLVPYLFGLALAGFLWAVAPHLLAAPGSDDQVVIAIFVGGVVLVGVVGNFLYYLTAVVYFATFIVPALVSLGLVYIDRFEGVEWTFAGIVFMFVMYAYKCLEVLTLPMGHALELNEALTTEKERAEASDRAKSDFLAMMSHELRTPLNAIMGYSEIIRDRVFGEDGGKRNVEHAGRIREAAGLLADLIGDLLELSALEANGRTLKIEPVEVGGIVALAVELLKDSAGKKEIRIQPRIPDGLPPLSIDRRAGIQCLTNILGNAVKYSPNGAEIFIEAGLAGRFLEVRVRDTGPGIPDHELAGITKPFQRGGTALESRAQGVGLGLSIAENLMRRHGGELVVTSGPQGGTTATLVFPLDPPAVAS